MVYKKQDIFFLRENDEIDDFEDGFMIGYLQAYNKKEKKNKDGHY
ncbi:MAG: hypothetical protein V1663_03020 [archaeon]